MHGLRARQMTTSCRLACSAGLAVLAAPAALADVTIADVAPDSTVLVAGTDSFQTLRQAFQDAGLMKVWDDPSIRDWIMEAIADGMQELEAELDNLGFKLEDLAPPTGPAGVAIYIDPLADDDDAPFNIIALADFGDGADKMNELLDAAMDESERKGEITLTDDTYRGVTIYTIEQIAVEENADDEWADDGMDWEDEWGAEPESPIAMDTVLYAWSGSNLVWGSSIDAVQDTIDRLAGQAINSISDDATYLDALAMVGKHEAFAVVRTEPLFEMMEREEAANGGGMMGPLMGALGVRDIRALSMGMTFDSAQAVSEWTMAALAPNRSGILELFEAPAQAFTPPAFASGDAMSIGAFQFNFSGLIPVARRAITELPPQMQEMASMQMPQIEAMAGPILANLGPRVYTLQSLKRPFSATSQQMLFAIQARNEPQLAQTIAGFAPMMQLQSRDFMGGQIWAPSHTMPGVPEFGMGLGAGHLFMGQVAAVESAMRTASDADAPRLADEATVTAALGALPAQGLGYSWTNLRQTMEFAKWNMENQEKIMRDQFQAMWGDDPEMAAFMDEEIEAQMANIPDFMKNIPDLDALYDVMGDMVSDYRMTDQGFVMKGYVLKPRN